MDDTLFLFLIMGGTFVMVPTIVWVYGLVWRELFKKGYIKKKRQHGTRQALEAYLFLESDVGLKMDVFQVLMSLISCGCFVVAAHTNTHAVSE